MELLIAIIVIVAVLLGGGFLIPLLFRRVVPTNEVHIVQNAKETKSYGKDTGNGNTYYQWPTWLPVIGIEVKSLAVSIFNVELDGYDAYDKGRLQFLVDVVAFFRISDYAQAAQRVSTTQELESQLTTIVKGSVRSILAKSEIEQIMEERSMFGELFTNEVKEQLKSWGVEAVKNIELMDVKDAKGSEIIHNIMAKKKSHIEMESRLEVAKNMKLAQIAEIEAKREVDLGKQEASQQIGLRTAQAEKEVEMAVESKKQAIIEQTKVTTEKEMEVVRIRSTKTAEVNKEVALVAAAQKKEVALVTVNQEKEVALVNASQEKEVALIQANRDKDVAILDATKAKESGIIKADADFQVKTKQADADAQVQQRKADAEAQAKLRLAEATAESTKKQADADLTVQLNNAQGLAANGKAKAEAEAALLMAPVTAQIAQAKEIGENKDYQQYLITVEQIKAGAEVGKAQAKALEGADIKVMASAGSAGEGLTSAAQILSAKGGSQVAQMLEGLASSDVGKALVEKFLTPKV